MLEGINDCFHFCDHIFPRIFSGIFQLVELGFYLLDLLISCCHKYCPSFWFGLAKKAAELDGGGLWRLTLE